MDVAADVVLESGAEAGPDARLPREVEHGVDVCEQPVEVGLEQVGLEDVEIGRVLALAGGVVVVVERVEPDDLVAARHQRRDEV